MKLIAKLFLSISAAALLAVNASPQDQHTETPKCLASQSAKMNAPCSTRQQDSAAQNQDSAQEKQKRLPSLLRRWLEMAANTQASQPDWLSPLATTSGRLKQEFRYDVWDQPAAPGSTFQLGGNKGLEFITSPRTQLLLGVPNYTFRSEKGPPGGFGDLPLMLKVRIASAENAEGNYLLTFILAATVPTGAHHYGAGAAVLTPTLALGKGWGRFDTQSTIGITLPTGNTTKLGRQLQWNTAFQYRAAWKLWPELEVNSTFFQTGKAREKQVFLTPGLGFGRVRIGRGFRFSTAVGMQIAVTRFHTYNHRWMFSERLSF